MSRRTLSVRHVSSALAGVALLLLASAQVIAGCGDDEGEACTPGEYECVGQTLNKCGNDGTFAFDTDCTGQGECRAIHGHCHPAAGGAGGHSAGGHSAGGHSAGGHSAGGHSAGGHMAGGAGGK